MIYKDSFCTKIVSSCQLSNHLGQLGMWIKALRGPRIWICLWWCKQSDCLEWLVTLQLIVQYSLYHLSHHSLWMTSAKMNYLQYWPVTKDHIRLLVWHKSWEIICKIFANYRHPKCDSIERTLKRTIQMMTTLTNQLSSDVRSDRKYNVWLSKLFQGSLRVRGGSSTNFKSSAMVTTVS